MAAPEERAASEVIGAVIIFGFLIIAFTIYQGVVIPQQNKAIEFDHNGETQEAIQELRNAIRQTATTAAEESVSITLGASYPQRVLGINPGMSAGSIQTEALPPIYVQNVRALDPETADYIGASTNTLGSFQTKAVVYRPIYFQYTNSPDTLYENSLAYNQFAGAANLTITNQAIIDDRKITLIALDGNVSEARQGTISIDTKALSTASNTVSITSDSGPINITFGTRFTAADWNETLQGELTTNGGHITDVRQTGQNQVSIILEQGITYDLRLAKVGVGDETSPEDPKYIVDVEGDNTSVIENGTQKLVVEVRDRFNNPVSNVTVDATIVQSANASNDAISPTSATTQADGRATFTYTAPDDVNGAQEADINMTFGVGTDQNETVTFDVRVLDADGSGSGAGGGDSDGEDSQSGTEGAGFGQYSDFQEQQTQTVSAEGGIWDNVTTLDSVLLKKLYIDSDKDPFAGDTKKFKIEFFVGNKTTGDEYKFKVELKYDWDSNTWQDNKVEIDGPGGKIIDEKNDALVEAELDSIYLPLDGSGELDLIGNDDYQGNPWSQSDLDDFQAFAGEDTFVYFDKVEEGSVRIKLQ